MVKSQYGIEVLAPGVGEPVADVVFVHGLTGGRRTTWSGSSKLVGNKNEEKPRKKFDVFSRSKVRVSEDTAPHHTIKESLCWPETLLPGIIRNCRIMTWGYDADVTHFFKPASGNTTFQHAQNLLAELERHRRDLSEINRPIVFVCHSLGGIIVKDALECSRNTLLDHLQPIFKASYGVVFLGTPHQGSGKADLGEVATTVLKAFLHDANSALLRDLRVDSQTLDRVSAAFSRMLAEREIKVYSFWEELGMTNVVGAGKVVERSSAIIGDAREGKEGVHGNHRTMTKFTSAQDSGFKKVSDVIWRFVRDATMASGNPTQLIKPLTEYRQIPFDRSLTFRGRRKVIADVFSAFGSPDGSMVVLTGLGGAGKTSIAKECAHAWMDRMASSIIWINADTVETITKDLSRILNHSGEDSKSFLPDDPQTAQTFCNFLQQRKGWLLIFDNADNITIGFEGYIPPNARGRILFTSRNSRLARLLRNSVEIKIEGLPDDEALEMFWAVADRNDLSEEYLDGQHVAQCIVKELENFPLAIAQAASFLRFYHSISGTEYIRYLRDEAERPTLLSFSASYENYNETVMTTWEVSYQSLFDDPKTVNAARLLCLLGFLDLGGVSESHLHSAHESRDGILRAELLNNAGYLKDTLDFRLSVDTLGALSLVQKLESRRYHEYHGWQDDILALHPLVHEWIRVRLLRDKNGKRLRDEMVAFSGALALHQVRLSEEWEDRQLNEYYGRPQPQRDESITHTKQALVDMESIGIETVLLASADILYRQWIPISAEAQLLPAPGLHFADNPYSVIDIRDSDVCDELHDAPTHLNAMVYETWCPLWAGLYDSWFIVENLVIDIHDQRYTSYIKCLVAGLRCLRALAKELLPCSLLDPGPPPGQNLATPQDPFTWGEELKTALNTFSEKQPVSQLFHQWNISHDAIPSVSEVDRDCAWYTHFRHSHSILLAAINGSLWPQYLRIFLYPTMKSDISICERDAYYALEEPMTERAWEWEARCPHITPHTVMDRARILLPRRFSRFYKAGRFPEAEKVLIDSLDGSISQEKEPRLRAIVVTADSMWSRGAYGESKKFLSSYATRFMGGTRWSVQKSICRLCVSILESGGRNSLEDAEDLLIEFIVAMVPKFVKPTQNWAETLVLWLREINPATYSALALGRIYAQCELYNEAATLLSWGLDFSGGNPQRSPVKRLLQCQRELGILSNEVFQKLDEEADKPSEYRGRKHNYEHSGSLTVIQNNLFDNCRQKVRDLEGQNQGVKKRFYDYLKRHNRDDFGNVDAVWDTMLMTRSTVSSSSNVTGQPLAAYMGSNTP